MFPVMLQVHAYERINRVYDYKYDPCGPLYISVGDGGNAERLALLHADDEDGCPDPMKSLDKNFANLSGYCGFNFTNGKFCWDKQPAWSAFRDSSFGHGIIEVSIESFSSCILNLLSGSCCLCVGLPKY